MLQITAPLNMNGNEIKNMKFEEHTADPTIDNFEGKVYTNTTTGVVRKYTSGAFVDMIDEVNIVFVDLPANLPTVGRLDKLYVTKDDAQQHIWDTVTETYLLLIGSSAEGGFDFLGTNVSLDATGYYEMNNAREITLPTGGVGDLLSLAIDPFFVAATSSTWSDLHGTSATDTTFTVIPDNHAVAIDLNITDMLGSGKLRLTMNCEDDLSVATVWDKVRIYIKDMVDQRDEIIISEGVCVNSTSTTDAPIFEFTNFTQRDPDFTQATIIVRNKTGVTLNMTDGVAAGRTPNWIIEGAEEDTTFTDIKVAVGGMMDNVVDRYLRVFTHGIIDFYCIGDNDWRTSTDSTPIEDLRREELSSRLARCNATKAIEYTRWGAIPEVIRPDMHVHETFTSVTTHTITHNLGFYPSVVVTDDTGLEITPDTITNDDNDNMTITFLTATTGTITVI